MRQSNRPTPQPALAVFREHGLDAMLRVYRSNMRLPSFRWKQRLWQWPIGLRFLDFLSEINDGAADLPRLSVSQSAWDTLRRLAFDLAVEWRTPAESLKDRPVIFYARHPSYIEPLPVLAALRELDPKPVATAWLTKLSPHTAERIIAVPDSSEATRRALDRYTGPRKVLETLWAHLVVFRVIKWLQGDMPLEVCQRQRRAAVRGILGTLAARKPILLFPAGGEGQKPWAKRPLDSFERLLRILHRSGPAGLHLVPVKIEGSLRALLRSRAFIPLHPLALASRLLPRRPFRVVVCEPMELAALAAEKTSWEGRLAALMGKL